MLGRVSRQGASPSTLDAREVLARSNQVNERHDGLVPTCVEFPLDEVAAGVIGKVGLRSG
jgi:hypothetical protein